MKEHPEIHVPIPKGYYPFVRGFQDEKLVIELRKTPGFVSLEPLESQAVEEKKVYNGYNWTVEGITHNLVPNTIPHVSDGNPCWCNAIFKAPKEACYCNADTKCWNCATNDLLKIEEIDRNKVDIIGKVNELVRAFNRLGK